MRSRESHYYLKDGNTSILEVSVREVLPVSLSEEPQEGTYPVLHLQAEGLSTDDILAILSSEYQIPKRYMRFNLREPLIGSRLWPDNLTDSNLNLRFKLSQYVLVKAKMREFPSDPVQLFSEGSKRLQVKLIGYVPQERWRDGEKMVSLSCRLTPEGRAKLLRLEELMRDRWVFNLWGHSEYVTSWLRIAPLILRGMRLELSEEYVVREMLRGLRGTPLEGVIKRRDRFGSVLSRMREHLLTDVFPAFRRMLWNWMATEILVSNLRGLKDRAYRVSVDGYLLGLELGELLREKGKLRELLRKSLSMPSPAANYSSDEWRRLASILRRFSLDLSHLTASLDELPLFPPGRRKLFYKPKRIIVSTSTEVSVLTLTVVSWASVEALLIILRNTLGS